MHFKPTRARLATVAGGSRSAESGNGASNVRSSPRSITCRFSVMRGSPGGPDSAGNGKRIGKAGVFQPGGEIGDQFMLAAVKMRATADVEQQAIGCIAGHQRRVTQTPVGN